ncbi:MAG: hypothetical protein U0163_06285 [Gemmatimonadaceae bacterium]
MQRSVGRTAMIIGLGVTLAAWTQATDPRLATRLDARTRDQVSAIVDSATREGIPTEPLIDRALEGASKRADGTLIVNAVRVFARDLRRARTALGPTSTEAEVVAGAHALRAGVKEQDLERFRQVRTGQRYALALDVMTYVINRGVQADTASNVVTGLVLAAASDDQLVAFRVDVDRDIAGGVPASLAATSRGVGLERAVLAARAGDGGAPGAALPSGRGSIAPGGLPVNGGVAGAVNGNATAAGAAPGEASRPPAPRGKPKKKGP